MRIDTYKISVNEENLVFAFGDFDPKSETIQDTINSNNGDGRKVLATVVPTLNLFFKKHPKAEVFFMGSTLMRTRIYHRIIKEYYDQFYDEYYILGHKIGDNNSFEKFDKNENYVQFSILKK